MSPGGHVAAGPEKGREGTDGKSNVQSLWVWGLGAEGRSW